MLKKINSLSAVSGDHTIKTDSVACNAPHHLRGQCIRVKPSVLNIPYHSNLIKLLSSMVCDASPLHDDYLVAFAKNK
ncbi:hypothetical protein [Glaciimonas sp. CA11.2]|uniref:hypothetical protein n=1 Tax=Glaciimonas sp. CA11.2 TaxID=3048601 RepID=UPI002B224249|nr:hypothetical protein [Glaciimonas sp. CA11.2]